MVDNIEKVDSGTRSKVISELNARLEALEIKNAQLTTKNRELTASAKELNTEVEELRNYKQDTTSRGEFDALGGKEEYFGAFSKLKEELGESPTKSQISRFKTKYSTFFKDPETSTPTNSVAGEAISSGISNANKISPNAIVDEGDEGVRVER